jgi:glycosyltransferase involved in cell wall biosynthesis
MRIAYVVADRGIPAFASKGASIHVREMVDAFSDLGHPVTLLVALFGQATGTVAADIVKIRPTEDRACERQYAAMAPWQEAAEGRRLREAVALTTGDTAEELLLQLHGGAPFDLIYERYSLFSAAGVRASKALGVPCLVEVNAPLVLEQRRFRKLVHVDLAEAIEAEVFKNADGLITVSEQVRTYALAKGAAPERTQIVPNGVNTSRFHPGAAARRRDGLAHKFVVGFSGSLKPWHGIELLLDAFRLLARRFPDYHLLVVGDGPLREWIAGYARGAGLDGAVTATGWLAHEELPGALRAMDVAVAPYPATEGFYFSPLKLYEYMAVGAPVVASRLGQITEVVEHGATGLLVEPGDSAALADGIERLRLDPALRRAIGARAAQRASAFTWRRNADRVIELARTARRARSVPAPA